MRVFGADLSEPYTDEAILLLQAIGNCPCVVLFLRVLEATGLLLTALLMLVSYGVSTWDRLSSRQGASAQFLQKPLSTMNLQPCLLPSGRAHLHQLCLRGLAVRIHRLHHHPSQYPPPSQLCTVIKHRRTGEQVSLKGNGWPSEPSDRRKLHRRYCPCIPAICGYSEVE